MPILKILAMILKIPVVRRAWDAAVVAMWNLVPGARRVSARERRVLATLQRDSIRRELANREIAAREHEERQRLAYIRLWQSVRSSADGANPPKTLNPSVLADVNLALTVVGDYDAAREEPGLFADCLYRPVADLPYPESAIRRCCEFLIGIAEGGSASFAGNYEMLASERDALGVALFSLDYFLDLPASEIPRQKLQNLAYARRQYLAGATPLTKPRQGEMVVRSGSGGTDSVDQVIGICDNDQWMILTGSGIPIQITRNEQLGAWDEVQVIAPAPASWLDLTPPAGIPTFGA